MDLRRKDRLAAESIVDARQRVTRPRISEMKRILRERLVAALPASAVYPNDQRRRGGRPVRQIKIKPLRRAPARHIRNIQNPRKSPLRL